MKIIQVIGARPNFMKVAPLHRALESYANMKSFIVHTGQHSDANMSDVFLGQLNLPKPDYYLGASGITHTQMMSTIMIAFEKVLQHINPQLVIVVGDVNSTLACALTAVRMNIPVAHVEAGLRSTDRTMPEEINRILTDQLSDILFTTEKDANENLIKENIPESKIHFVGNCMIDSLIRYLPQANTDNILQKLKGDNFPYVLMTMHRPSNVDSQMGLENILRICEIISKKIRIIFPVHPRTKNRMESFGLWNDVSTNDGMILTEPLGYLEFLSLMKNATAVLTDSGGIQEETTFLNIPCLTFRETTERPITIELGSNVLIKDFNLNQTLGYLDQIIKGNWKTSIIPELWDGHAAERIAKVLNDAFDHSSSHSFPN